MKNCFALNVNGLNSEYIVFTSIGDLLNYAFTTTSYITDNTTVVSGVVDETINNAPFGSLVSSESIAVYQELFNLKSIAAIKPIPSIEEVLDKHKKRIDILDKIKNTRFLISGLKDINIIEAGFKYDDLNLKKETAFREVFKDIESDSKTIELESSVISPFEQSLKQAARDYIKQVVQICETRISELEYEFATL